MGTQAIPIQIAPAENFALIHMEKFPVVGALVVHAAANVIKDLKPLIGDRLVKRIAMRVVGDIVKAGAGVGTLTGKENPEALLIALNVRTSPSFGVNMKNDLSARLNISQHIFDYGYALRETDITDAAATVAIDCWYPIEWQGSQRRAPQEFLLPMSAFKSFTVTAKFGGREQMFTGGTNTWDLSALRVEFWAEIEDGTRSPFFHLSEEFELPVPIVATNSRLPVDLDEGYVYESLLFLAERDNVVDDTIINDISIVSGSREWFKKGDANGKAIRRNNKYRVLPSETLTGLYFVDLMKTEMVSRGANGLAEKLQVLLDVTLGAGTVRMVTIRGRRFKPEFFRT